MFTPTRRNGATVVRLRLASAGHDPLVERLRAAAALEATALEPTRLPPAAVLCIRRLRDPRPGTLRLDRAQPFAALPGAPAWQQAVTARLDELSAAALRPLVEAVSDRAESVVFADQAELLACLALDWLSGRLARRWWWWHLLRNVDARDGVFRAWLEAPDCVPAALAHVAARGDVVAFARQLTEPDVERLTEAVVERFGLGRLLRTIRAADRPAAPTAGAQAAAAAAAAPPPAAAEPAAARLAPTAPWHDLVPPAAAGLSRERQLWLGLGLSLARRLVAARATAFAWHAHRWYEAQRLAAPVARSAAPPAPAERRPASPGARASGEATDRGGASDTPGETPAPAGWPTPRSVDGAEPPAWADADAGGAALAV